MLLARTLGFYDRQSTFHLQSSADDLPTILLLTTLATWLGVVALQLMHLSHPRLEVATKFWLAALVCVSVSRAAARIVVRNSPHVSERAIILGSGIVAARLAQKLGSRPSGLHIVGYLDDDPLPVGSTNFAYLGRTSHLEEVIHAYEIEQVLVAFSRMDIQKQVDLTRRCMELEVRVDIVPRMFEVIGTKNRVHDLEGIPLVEVKPAKLSRSARLLKRSLDLTAAGAALVFVRAVHALCSLADQARFPRAGPFPAGADGSGRHSLRDSQVPNDGRGRRPAQARGRPPEQALGGRPADVQDRRRPADHPLRRTSFAAGRWTSCRSS